MKPRLHTRASLLSLTVAAVACSNGSAPVARPAPSAPGVAPLTAARTSVAADSVGPASSTPASNPSAGELRRSGGDATVDNVGSNAFAQGIVTLSREERRAFAVGNSFFNDNWVTAPGSAVARDGLGPLFNAQSCSSCHQFDGRGAPPVDATDPERGLLLRLSVAGADGQSVPDPTYGGQLQDRAIGAIAPEGRIVITNREVPGTFADGTPYTLLEPTYSIADLAYGPLSDGIMISPRVAPAVFGVGLLETVPAADLLARSDPDDVDGDGISGRPNMVSDEAGRSVVGRFGWKANVATVNQQNAGAFHGDVGITSALHPEQECTSAQSDCLAAPSGGAPELQDDKLQRITFYTRTLAVPARRDVAMPDTDAGAELFQQLGCASCHVSEMTTGNSDIAALEDQTIRPYTDLLLHDMGPALADQRPDGQASGSEWRTAPLWGIGLVDDVNGHTRFLHDGRARNLQEAILWHGGEAAAAQQRFRELSADARGQLVAFLESL
jgi:CxxC motif-containing protein (DUF1111 family)